MKKKKNDPFVQWPMLVRILRLRMVLSLKWEIIRKKNIFLWCHQKHMTFRIPKIAIGPPGRKYSAFTAVCLSFKRKICSHASTLAAFQLCLTWKIFQFLCMQSRPKSLARVDVCWLFTPYPEFLPPFEAFLAIASRLLREYFQNKVYDARKVLIWREKVGWESGKRETCTPFRERLRRFVTLDWKLESILRFSRM